MNVYRAGWWHRAGKPDTLNIHAGDFYVSIDAAIAAIDPIGHYVATVPFVMTADAALLKANSHASLPTPLAENPGA
jgi:hypothetical protein